MNIEKWAPSEPRPNRPCAYMDMDGEWKTTLCNQTYYGVCEKTTGEIQVCVCPKIQPIVMDTILSNYLDL